MCTRIHTNLYMYVCGFIFTCSVTYYKLSMANQRMIIIMINIINNYTCIYDTIICILEGLKRTMYTCIYTRTNMIYKYIHGYI